MEQEQPNKSEPSLVKQACERLHLDKGWEVIPGYLLVEKMPGGNFSAQMYLVDNSGLIWRTGTWLYPVITPSTSDDAPHSSPSSDTT